MNALTLIDETIADVQANIDLCVGAIQQFAKMKASGESGAAELLKEQGEALVCYQAQRGILERVRRELVGEDES